MAFREDDSSIHLRNAGLNFALLRRIAMNLFRSDTTRKISMSKKRKLAAWNPDYLVTVLNLKPI